MNPEHFRRAIRFYYPALVLEHALAIESRQRIRRAFVFIGLMLAVISGVHKLISIPIGGYTLPPIPVLSFFFPATLALKIPAKG
jgi:hypothetical protein